MNTPSHHDLKDEVLNKIRTGDVHMRPRAYFVVKLLLIAFITALIVIVAAWLVSFIIFSLNISERVMLLDFGWRGVRAFLWLFPWRLLFVEVALVFLLNWLLHYFRFGYRSPIVYSLLGGLILSGIIAVAMNSGALQETLLHHHQANKLPLIGSLYEKIEQPDNGPEVVRGIIVSIGHDSLLIKDTDEENMLITVLLPQIPMHIPMLNVGDEVFVAGDLVSDTLRAYGIKKVTRFRTIRMHF